VCAAFTRTGACALEALGQCAFAHPCTRGDACPTVRAERVRRQRQAAAATAAANATASGAAATAHAACAASRTDDGDATLECTRVHVRAIRRCKFGARDQCKSAECVMLHFGGAGGGEQHDAAAHATSGGGAAAPLGGTAITATAASATTTAVATATSADSPLCEFFNRRSGCLSVRTVAFICGRRHACAVCGAPEHGAPLCPHR